LVINLKTANATISSTQKPLENLTWLNASGSSNVLVKSVNRGISALSRLRLVLEQLAQSPWTYCLARSSCRLTFKSDRAEGRIGAIGR
jgi:hypothetical protein